MKITHSSVIVAWILSPALAALSLGSAPVHASELDEWNVLRTSDRSMDGATLLTVDESAENAAGAATDQERGENRPVVRHLPEVELEKFQPFDMEITIDSDWLAETFFLRWRREGDVAWQEVPFRRSTSRAFAARVPAEEVREPAMEYTIVSEGARGRIEHFASENRPMRVAVFPSEGEVRFDVRNARHDGHRNQVFVRGSYTDFGTREVELRDDPPVGTLARSEYLWTGVAEYRHRLWTEVYDIHFKLQVERGAFGSVPTESGETESVCTHGDCGSVGGLYAGRGGATFELWRFLSIETDVILAASHRGFGAGIGSVVRIGEIAGTRFEVEGEYIDKVGGRGEFRFLWDTVPMVPMSLGLELGTRPDPRTASVSTILRYGIGLELPGAITIEAQVGSALRANGTRYGWTAGLGVVQNF